MVAKPNTSLRDVKKKIAFFVQLIFFAILTSCTSPSCWTAQNVISDYPSFNSALLTFKPKNLFNGIEVQFLKGNFGIVGFLNIHCCEFQTDKFYFVIQGKSFFYQGTLMAGNQRLQLPPDATHILGHTLLNGHEVVVVSENYSSTLLPTCFGRLVDRFFNRLYSRLSLK